MKKTTKGAIAAGAAVVLLLSTGGTLAYWNSTADIGGANITAGRLSVAQTTAPSWSITHAGSTTPVAVTDITAVRIVPGDTLTYTGSYAVSSQGQNLTFTVGLGGGAISSDTTAANIALRDRLTETATFAVNGGAAISAGTTVTIPTPTTAPNDVKTTPVTVTATLTWPFNGTPAVDNPAQTGTVSLANFALTVTQV